LIISSGHYFLTAILSALVVLAVGSFALGWLREHGCRQHIRDDGPQAHLAKSGTPTMGGVLFIPVFLLVGLLVPVLFRQWQNSLLLVAGLTWAYMLIGLTDDLLMLKRGKSLGLKARQKLALQCLFAIVFLYALSRITPFIVLRLPFTLTLLHLQSPLWHYIYYVLAFIFIVGMANSTNLTDGLDGLLAGLSIICGISLALICAWLKQPALAFFTCALVGACLGFLYYNRNPARVFMGDTGSLALGGAFVGIATLLHIEILLFIFGAIFLVESLSVMIQVIYFKRTGRRIFKMSPIHHHFELSGWPETRVVKVFWSVSALISAVVLVGTYVGWKV
jgi:phospho-N-acetylmuramoyl-pentapeptide-transferase